jgi:hypothetical protein
MAAVLCILIYLSFDLMTATNELEEADIQILLFEDIS